MEIIRRENGQQVGTQLAPSWEPGKLMRDWLRWDPFQTISPFGSLIERGAVSFQPSFDVRETKEAYIVKADVPGMKEENLEVSLNGDRLQINGKRDQEKEEMTDTYYTCERSYGSFTRVFTLPADVDGDKIKAEMKDGVLNVTLAKKPNAQAKRIPVKASKS